MTIAFRHLAGRTAMDKPVDHLQFLVQKPTRVQWDRENNRYFPVHVYVGRSRYLHWRFGRSTCLRQRIGGHNQLGRSVCPGQAWRLYSHILRFQLDRYHYRMINYYGNSLFVWRCVIIYMFLYYSFALINDNLLILGRSFNVYPETHLLLLLHFVQ